MRKAYGLARIESFSSLTGEQLEAFSESDPLTDTSDPLNDPNILDFIELRDAEGQLLELGSDAANTEAIIGVRRTTLAARLKALYSDIDKVDAFVGMVSEPHLGGSGLGELQHSIWKQQFEALRDGDRYFYAWNKSLKNRNVFCLF
jgi:peroxidase